jgi:hypothetical protein
VNRHRTVRMRDLTANVIANLTKLGQFLRSATGCAAMVYKSTTRATMAVPHPAHSRRVPPAQVLPICNGRTDDAPYDSRSASRTAPSIDALDAQAWGIARRDATAGRKLAYTCEFLQPHSRAFCVDDEHRCEEFGASLHVSSALP